MAEVFELFPTPVQRVPSLLTPAEAQELARRLAATAVLANDRSGELAHSRILGPGDDAGLANLVARLGPPVQEFGALLFGETLRWLVKELWVNVLQPGGQQAMHNHANCFVSGILYLTESDASARTVFLRGLGGSDFAFRNAHAGVQDGRFHSEKWAAPAPAPGDLLLFPSYLLHEVPPNRGAARVTLAFNAIPHRLDAWGYTVSFAP
jgi:hypothetical protein